MVSLSRAVYLHTPFRLHKRVRAWRAAIARRFFATKALKPCSVFGAKRSPAARRNPPANRLTKPPPTTARRQPPGETRPPTTDDMTPRFSRQRVFTRARQRFSRQWVFTRARQRFSRPPAPPAPTAHGGELDALALLRVVVECIIHFPEGKTRRATLCGVLEVGVPERRCHETGVCGQHDYGRGSLYRGAVPWRRGTRPLVVAQPVRRGGSI